MDTLELQKKAERLGLDKRSKGERTRDEIRAYWKKHNKPVPNGHRLCIKQYNQCFSHPSFRKEARAYGLLSCIERGERKRNEIRAYWKKHDKPVPRGHRLYIGQHSQCSNHPSFRKEARAYGLLPPPERRENERNEIRAYWKKHNKPVPNGHRLYLAQRSQCFHPSFRKEARAYGLFSSTERGEKSRDEIRAYWKKHSRCVPRGHSLYTRQMIYCSKYPLFKKEATLYGWLSSSERGERTRDEIRAYWRKNEALVPTRHSLYEKQHDQCQRHPFFRKEARAYGSCSVIERGERTRDEIRAYWKKHGRTAPYGHRLYQNQQSHYKNRPSFRKESERYREKS